MFVGLYTTIMLLTSGEDFVGQGISASCFVTHLAYQKQSFLQFG